MAANVILTYQDLMMRRLGMCVKRYFWKSLGGRVLEVAGWFCNSLSMRKVATKRPPKLSHQWIDLVDLAMHRAIARKIRREPKLYRRASRRLAHWEKVKRACPPPLREWKQILRDKDMNTVLRIITRADEEGNRLRSIAPFCDILTEQEVKAVWARYD